MNTKIVNNTKVNKLKIVKDSNIIENSNIFIGEEKKVGVWKNIFINVMSTFLWKVLSFAIGLGIFLFICWMNYN